MADRTGQTIGEYTLREPLDTDRYGTRYRATATATGDAASVRIIPPPTSDDRWFADRVGSTLRRYSGVGDPHLAALLAVGAVDGAVYAVGPPLVGESLRSRLGAPLSPAAVAALLGPIAAALDTIHGRYLVHGDLRPETIILTANGPLLVDAGLAAAVADATRLATGSAPAPPAAEAIYRAPETFTGGLTDARADIYSLAVIAYEALTGQPPTRSATGSASAGQGDQGASTPPRERNAALSETANDLLLRGLAPSPYQRPATAGELIAALGPAAESPTTSVPATPPSFAPATQPDRPSSPPRPQASAFTTPAPLAAPAWTTSTVDLSTVPPPPHPPAPPISLAPPAPRPAPQIAASETSGQQRPSPPAPRIAETGGERASGTSDGFSAAYTYVSPPHLETSARPRDTSPQLVASRTRLINTLAALARQRAAPPLTVGRQQLVSTLHGVTTTTTTAGGRTRPAALPTRRQQEATRRPAATERGARYVDDWREVYRVLPGEAAMALLKSGGTLVGGFLFVGLFFSGLRCLIGCAAIMALTGLMVWRVETTHIIICNAEGFIVESGFFPWWRVGRFYRWSEVRATRYHEANVSRSRSNKGSTSGVGHFAVTTPSGEVFDQTNTYAGFDFKGLLSRFAAQTPHLPYAWLPNEQVGTRPVIERVGEYSMVTRTP